MRSLSAPARQRPKGFTLIEVLVAATLVAIGLGSVLSIHARTLRTLRSTRQAAASSQMLQQRIEMIRGMAWPEIANSTALAGLMRTATESEKELTDANLIEFMKVSVPDVGGGSSATGGRAFSLQRQRGNVHVDESGNFGDEPTLIFESSLTWNDVDGDHRRMLRTIVCRAGLMRSGIFGSALGRAQSGK